MDKEKTERICKELYDALDLIYTLKVALLNEEQPEKDTLPYSAVAGMIENKIHSVLEIIEE